MMGINKVKIAYDKPEIVKILNGIKGSFRMIYILQESRLSSNKLRLSFNKTAQQSFYRNKWDMAKLFPVSPKDGSKLC